MSLIDCQNLRAEQKRQLASRLMRKQQERLPPHKRIFQDPHLSSSPTTLPSTSSSPSPPLLCFHEVPVLDTEEVATTTEVEDNTLTLTKVEEDEGGVKIFTYSTAAAPSSPPLPLPPSPPLPPLTLDKDSAETKYNQFDSVGKRRQALSLLSSSSPSTSFTIADSASESWYRCWKSATETVPDDPNNQLVLLVAALVLSNKDNDLSAEALVEKGIAATPHPDDRTQEEFRQFRKLVTDHPYVFVSLPSRFLRPASFYCRIGKTSNENLLILQAMMEDCDKNICERNFSQSVECIARFGKTLHRWMGDSEQDEFRVNAKTSYFTCLLAFLYFKVMRPFEHVFRHVMDDPHEIKISSPTTAPPLSYLTTMGNLLIELSRFEGSPHIYGMLKHEASEINDYYARNTLERKPLFDLDKTEFSLEYKDPHCASSSSSSSLPCTKHTSKSGVAPNKLKSNRKSKSKPFSVATAPSSSTGPSPPPSPSSVTAAPHPPGSELTTTVPKIEEDHQQKRREKEELRRQRQEEAAAKALELQRQQEEEMQRHKEIREMARKEKKRMRRECRAMEEEDWLAAAWQRPATTASSLTLAQDAESPTPPSSLSSPCLSETTSVSEESNETETTPSQENRASASSSDQLAQLYSQYLRTDKSDDEEAKIRPPTPPTTPPPTKNEMVMVVGGGGGGGVVGGAAPTTNKSMFVLRRRVALRPILPLDMSPLMAGGVYCPHLFWNVYFTDVFQLRNRVQHGILPHAVSIIQQMIPTYSLGSRHWSCADLLPSQQADLAKYQAAIFLLLGHIGYLMEKHNEPYRLLLKGGRAFQLHMMNSGQVFDTTDMDFILVPRHAADYHETHAFSLSTHILRFVFWLLYLPPPAPRTTAGPSPPLPVQGSYLSILIPPEPPVASPPLSSCTTGGPSLATAASGTATVGKLSVAFPPGSVSSMPIRYVAVCDIDYRHTLQYHNTFFSNPCTEQFVNDDLLDVYRTPFPVTYLVQSLDTFLAEKRHFEKEYRHTNPRLAQKFARYFV